MITFNKRIVYNPELLTASLLSSVDWEEPGMGAVSDFLKGKVM
jgi:hypothetical protein